MTKVLSHVPLVDVNHAGTPEYRAVLERIAESGECPFCEDFCRGRAPKIHPNPILISTKWWIATRNMRPYPGVKEHLLLVPKVHVEKIETLPSEVWANLQVLLEAVNAEFNFPGFSFFMRTGEMTHTCGSVRHLHAQLLSGVSKEDPNDGVILAPLGYRQP